MMNKELYYCKYWEHIYYLDYEMCVSDLIYSDNKKMAQIHIIVMKENQVVRGASGLPLNEFENVIRESIRKRFNKQKASVDREVVKIWYYNIDNTPIDPNDVPLRFAITFVNPNEYISAEEYNIFKQNIYSYLQIFLDRIFKSSES